MRDESARHRSKYDMMPEGHGDQVECSVPLCLPLHTKE